MGRKLTIAWMMLMTVLPMAAQDMSIEGFARQKDSMLGLQKMKKDKKQATLLLTTGETGFTFKADGQTDIEAEEGEGLLTLKVPNKTQFLTITHANYGQLTWRAPDKGLRKKKIYHAYLRTYNPDKEYKLQKQWVVFQVSPRDAIIHVDDSLLTRIRDGKAQYYLPIGKHPYMVESPFYESVEDTLELTDIEKLVLPVNLQPVYSYLTVKTPFEACRIFLDNRPIGRREAVSSHLSAGSYRLSVFIDSLCYYDAPVAIGAAEKKVVELTASDLRQKPWKPQTRLVSIEPDTTSQTVADSTVFTAQTTRIKAPVAIKAPDGDTEIWLNREPVGNGSWEGELEEGYYIINTRKDGQESATRHLWITDEFPKEINIGAPQVDFGFLNVHSNVMGADVYVNDSLMGKTPCIVEELPAGKTYRVRLEQAMYKPTEQKVLILGNDMVDVMMTLRKKK
ncbi:MAG: PEGA domain-containing protein [Prevotella sp.]|nr:PEGA domain-containing protein [Prevotella sp.]